MFSPLAYWDAKNGGKRVGIIGIGGLGQMGVRLSQGDITMNITLSSGAFGEGDGEYGDCNLDLPWKRSRCSRDWGGQVKITS